MPSQGVGCVALGEEALRFASDLPIPVKQVERLTRAIGTERVRQRDADVAAFAALPLAQKFEAPEGVPAVGGVRGVSVGGPQWIPEGEAEGIRGRRQRERLAAARTLLRVVHGDSGLHPHTELRVFRREGGEEVRRKLGVLPEVDRAGVEGGGGEGNPGDEEEARGGGRAEGVRVGDERGERGGEA